MVIGRRFAWAHLPKTAGTATTAMFGVFGDLIEFADPIDSLEQHSLFRDRAREVDGKLLALNLRRLPAWVLSRAHYVNRNGVYPDFAPMTMPSPQQLAESSFPDFRLSEHTDRGRLRIDRWLRVESLAEDFLSFVAELRDVTADERTRVLGMDATNAIDYDRELSHWFTPEQLRLLYRTNPLWAAREEELYGSLVELG